MKRHFPIVVSASLVLSLAMCGESRRDMDESDDGQVETGGEAGFAAGGSAGNDAGTSGTSASGSSAGGVGGAAGEGSEAGDGAGGASGASATGGATGTGGATDTGGTSGTGGTGCDPLDVIVVVDNSGSMVEEMDALEWSINVELAVTLAELDYRVILLTRHRRENRTASDVASTSFCVSPPLSSLLACPSAEPGFSERFFHYDAKVETGTVLDSLIDRYSAPEDLAPYGYGVWLRAGVEKAIVFATDDDETTDDLNIYTPDAFLMALTALDPTNFGADSTHLNVTFHSIVGLKEKADPAVAYLPAEPLVSEVCTGNASAVESAGVTYQELSIRTNGLRVPICDFAGYGPIFQAIAASACE